MNRFTAPIQTNFVPTYAPMQIDTLARSANVMQGQRDTAMANYQGLNQRLSDTIGAVSEVDRPIIEEFLGGVEGEISKFAKEDNWRDARNTINKLAMDTDRFLKYGKGAKAVNNMAQRTQNVKQIREADHIPVSIRKGLEARELAGYQGVEAGDRISPISLPGEWKDWNDEALDMAKEIEDQPLDSFGYSKEDYYIKGKDGKAEARTGYKGEGSKTFKRRPDVIRDVVSNRLMSNREFIDQKQIEAEVLGHDPEDWLRAETIRLTNDAIKTKTTYDIEEPTASPWTTIKPIQDAPGIVQANDVIPDSPGQFFDGMREAYQYREKDPQLWAAKKSSFNHLLASAVKAGVLSKQDAASITTGMSESEYKDVFNESPEGMSALNTLGPFAKWVTKKGTSEGVPEDSPLGKLENYIESKPALITNNIAFDKPQMGAFKDLMFGYANDRSFEIINGDYTESQKKNILNTGLRQALTKGDTMVQLSYTDDGEMFYEVTYTDDDAEGGSRRLILRENIQSNQQGSQRHLGDHVADMIGGPAGERLREGFYLRDVEFFAEGPKGDKNLINQLPNHIKPRKVSYLQFEQEPNGMVTMITNNAEGEPDKFTNNDMFGIIKDALKTNPNNEEAKAQFGAFLNRLSANDEVPQEYIDYIAKTAKLPDALKNASVMKDSYLFSRPVEALSFVK